MTKEMGILNYRDTIILKVNSYSVGFVINSPIMSVCQCGRSPTNLCIGWHNLTEEEYKKKKKKYDELKEDEKEKNPFHARAIDGFGD